ncbi:MAG: ISKra4 family transposase, partial [Planctomycetales bacterium]|nr:ISKra4 family transposase [Planctomycetales bacterium]
MQTAARDGKSLYDTEKSILAAVLQMGHVATENFLKLQGNGDLGKTVETIEGKTLVRSPEPTARPLRTIFGEHVITAFVYAPGPKKKIELRPIDARLNLAAGKGSYLWEEFSQYFCVEQAFGQAASALETVFGQKISVDTLERTNQRLGGQAEQFLDVLPAPPSDEEGELLVATADGKGVPLIREHVESIPVHGPKPPRPNNRRMATVASVYSVDRYYRTPEDVLAALFRDERPDEPTEPRPVPCHKRMTACFPVLAEAGTEDELVLRGDTNAWTWAGKQIKDRRRKRQVLIRLCD